MPGKRDSIYSDMSFVTTQRETFWKLVASKNQTVIHFTIKELIAKLRRFGQLSVEIAVMKAMTNAIIMHIRVGISNADFSDSINLRTKATKAIGNFHVF